MALISTKWLENGSVTNDKLASNAVTNVKVAAGAAIAESKLALDYSTSSLNTAIGTKIASSEKGAASGVATLDGGGKIPASQLPNSVMEYKGSFDPAATSIADGTGNAGDVYRASAAGSKDFGAGAIAFLAGDMIIYSGSVWEKAPATDHVLSVNGYTGVVSLVKADISLGNVDNVQQLPMSYLDIDGALAANSDVKVASQKAVKTYADTKVAQTVTVNGHALSSNVTVTKSDVSLGSVDDVQQLPMSYLDIDNTLAANSDVKVASQKAIKAYVSSQISAIPAAASSRREVISLVAGDITNQYIDLAMVAANSASIQVLPKNGPPQVITDDFTVSLTGGAGGMTRISFAGDLAANAAATDKIVILYMA
jgi:hypothetical protein